MSTENAQTLDQFIVKHGIKFECRRVDARPDGLGDWDKTAQHFRCRISYTPKLPSRKEYVSLNECNPRSFGLYFSQGSAHTEDPTLADVLDCLASDAAGYENANGFEGWARDYGYDEDSRKAEKVWRAIKRQAEQLKRTIGDAAYQELLWNTEQL